MVLTKQQQKENDNKFKECCKVYMDSPNGSDKETNSWNAMFNLVYLAAEAAVKSKLKNIYRDDIDEVIEDTAIGVMSMISKKKTKGEDFVLRNRLVTLCYPYTLFPLYNKQDRFEEDILSMDQIVSDGGDRVFGTYLDDYDL